jgi:hypothetical protein
MNNNGNDDDDDDDDDDTSAMRNTVKTFHLFYTTQETFLFTHTLPNSQLTRPKCKFRQPSQSQASVVTN